MDISPRKELLRFLSEDIQRGDITSALLSNQKIKAKIISREQGIVAGVGFARSIFQLKGCTVRIFTKDGSRLKPNQTVLQVSGNAKSILSCERTVLNLVSRMSGIATQTNYLVSRIKKYSKKTNLYSTRKTAPGLRYFDKEAVIIGGLGSLWGTLAGGIILGVAQNIGAKIDPGWQILAGHVAFLIILIFRPNGLFPRTRDD